MSRRLPVYLLIDTSGSMKGEPITSVNIGLQSMLLHLRQDPLALESVHLSVITFDREARRILPLTELTTASIPYVDTPDSGPTHLGAALELLCHVVDQEVVRTTPERKGDWMPLLFIMTDGSPSDIQKFNEWIPEVKRRSFAFIVACAAGPKAKDAFLKELTPHIVYLDTADSRTFQKFFTWVSQTVNAGNRSVGAVAPLTLPPPPSELRVSD
jgi:uncharacterized protein YegL